MGRIFLWCMSLVLSAASLTLSPAPAQAKTLNVLLSDAPATLDWNGLVSMVEAPIVYQLCEGLYTYEYPSGKLIPGLAESVSKSKDLREYTFKIREDAKWSDGRPIYAQDFVDSWLRLLSPQSTSLYSYYLFGIENAKEYHQRELSSPDKVGIKAVGDRTLVVKLKHPNAKWEAVPTFWPMYPLRKDLIEKYGQNWWRAGVLLSSGPFTLDSYEPGKKLILKRNKHYKRFHSNIDEVDIYFEDNTAQALKKYQDGFFPFLDFLNPPEIKDLSKRADFKKSPLLKHYLLIVNAKKFPMGDSHFREAIFHALDPKVLSTSNPLFARAKTLIPPPLNGSQKAHAPVFSVTAAKEALKKSGVLNTKKLKVRVLTTLSEPYLGIGKAIKEQLAKNLGLEVELATHHTKEYNAYLALSDYDILVNSWTGKIPMPEDFLLPYSGEASNSRLKFSSEQFDDWLRTAMRTVDTKKQSELYSKAQALFQAEEHVLFPIFFESMAYLQNAKIERLYYNHMGIPVLKDVQLK